MSADSRLLAPGIRRAGLALRRAVLGAPGPGPLHRVLRRFEFDGEFGIPGALIRVPDPARREFLLSGGFIRSLGEAAE